jgi:hypothetical protein
VHVELHGAFCFSSRSLKVRLPVPKVSKPVLAEAVREAEEEDEEEDEDEEEEEGGGGGGGGVCRRRDADIVNGLLIHVSLTALNYYW